MSKKKKASSVELAAQMFQQGYATRDWFEKFSKAVREETKKPVKKKIKK